MQATVATGGADDQAVNDIGPLAWVLDELNKSLDIATKAIRRFVRDAEMARGSDLESVDASQLRVARQQLHQAVGALEMVGLEGPAKVLRGMEALAKKFVEHPESCSEDAADKVEKASFALMDFLQGVIRGRPGSAVGLFAQYRSVLELIGEDRIHPADLWTPEWRWIDVALPVNPPALPYAPAVRMRMDPAVLKVVKEANPAAAAELREISLGLAAGETAVEGRVFWKIAAAFFEAMALGLLRADIYAKRAGSRVLMQYSTLARGDRTISDRLAQDLLFFCAQARPKQGQSAPVLTAIRQAYGLDAAAVVDYEAVHYGRFDPAVLAQARKRIATATETWSALSGGETGKLKVVADQFAGVCESLLKLHPDGIELARAFTKAVESTVRSGAAPNASVAMEVATAILYLDASYEDMEPVSEEMTARSRRLAQRLEHVMGGGKPEPLEGWMEELYRRVSDRQTMGSVVDELRGGLGEVEKALDQYFRNPQDKQPLQQVPTHLMQMRGVFSVLGLDQASLATLRMRDMVESFMMDGTNAQAGAKAFERFGNSLGALGFLIDMLSYQRALAKKLFVFDEVAGEFKPLMGREAPEPRQEAPAAPVAPAAAPPVAAARPAAPAPVAAASPAVAAKPVTAPPAPAPKPVVAPAPEAEDDDAEMRDIFLEEAREVVGNGLAALLSLAGSPGDLGHQTTVRRAFHTLKGSSRMVGLNEFGEAAWAMEQLFNSWLAEQKPASTALQQLARDAMQAMSNWVEDIAVGKDDVWSAPPFRTSADGMRLEQKYIPLALPQSPTSHQDAAPVAQEQEEQADFQPTQMFDLDEEEAPAPPAAQALGSEAFEIDFGALSGVRQDSPAGTDAPSQSAVQDWASGGISFETEPVGLSAPDSGFSVGGNDVAELSLGGLDEPASPAFEPPAVQPYAGAAEPTIDLPSFDFPDSATEPVEASRSAAAELSTPSEGEEQTRVIGSLRIPIPLYNVFLNEADEWSRRLQTDLGEWALELHRPISDDTVGLAHSLGGSSATVGFRVLSEVARLLEQGLQHVQLQGAGQAEQAQVFVAAAEEIRHLLHQFAAGFLIEASPQVTQALRELINREPVATREVPGFDFKLELPNPPPERPRPPPRVSKIELPKDDPKDEGLSLDFMSMATAAAPETANGEPGQDEADAVVDGLTQDEASFLMGDEPAVPSDESAPQLGVSGFETPFSPEVPLITDLQGVDEAAADTPALDMLPEPEPEPEEPVIDLMALAEDAAAQEVDEVPSMAAQPEPAAVRSDRAGAARIIGSDHDDDIDAVDTIDPDLFPIFDEEAAELMPQLSAALRMWAQQPDDGSARMGVLRALHTLKGSARLAGAMRLGEMAHRMETAIEQMGSEGLQVEQIDPMLTRYDGLEQALWVLRHGEPEADDDAGIEPTPELPTLPAEVPDHQAMAAASDESAPVAAPAPAPRPAPLTAAPKRPAATGLSAPRSGGAQTVRVRSQLLDRLLNQAGEVMITRSKMDANLGQLRGSLDDLTDNLDRLRTHLRDIELHAEMQMQSRLAQAKETAQGFDPLEFDRFTRVQELTRMMAESVNDVATVQRNIQRTMEGTEDALLAQGHQTRELQRELLRTRMVEFEAISERLYGVVRQAAKDAGKQVRLDIQGGTIEMDRGVLERMAPAFEHMLRNSIAHGIEPASVREAMGKTPVGTITIELHHEGNDVSITFADDGAGLNLLRIRDKARASGLIPAGSQLSDAEAADLIFRPGFSTAAQVTELSGRGIGMDVVRAEINALGGRIETATQTGQGTSFQVVLPLTTAVTQVTMLRMGELAIGVPANLVEIVRRTPHAELEDAYRTGSISYAGEQLLFFWGGALLQTSSASQELHGKNHPVMIFRSAGQRLAVHVDEVLGNQEVVVKNLGPQLAQLPGLAGMSVLASGAVVLIYNPVALATVYGDKAMELQRVSGDRSPATVAGAAAQAPVATAGPSIPLVLVVDDSITVRRVTQRLLKREGYRVALAADGIHALEQLQQERPTVVLSDIEMPRMDGFDLARNIRADETMKDLPIIMITSRIAEKHREHAIELGVNHYLGKPYSEDELLQLIKQYSEQSMAV